MKKTIIFLFLFFVSVSLWAQFHTQTELKYLQIINADRNKELIKNNLWNAELKADSILYSKKNLLINRLFLIALSKSYFILKKYDLALLSLYKQRILFPDDSLSVENKQMFFELTYRNNFSDSISNLLWQETAKSHLPKTYNQRLHLLIKKAVDIHAKKLVPYIFNLAHLYERFAINKPICLKHWEFLSLIKVREKNKKQILSYIDNKRKPIYQLVTNRRLKYKIYRKAIKHYIRTNAIKKSKALIKEYQLNDLSIILNGDLVFKKLRVAIKSCF